MSKTGHNGGPRLYFSGDGWIAIHRDIRNHWLVGFGLPVKPMDDSRGSFSRNEAFVDLIMECRYEAGTVNNGGRKMDIQRGQLVGAVSWLSHRWNWTPKTVRKWLDDLENDDMIALGKPGVENGGQKGKQSQIITICNYDVYQVSSITEGQAKGQAEGKQGASKGQAKGNNSIDNKGTREQRNKEESNPQTPNGGSVGFDLLSDEPPPPKPLPRKAVARIAFQQWQDFATVHGLAVPKDSTFETFHEQILSRMSEHADEKNQRGMLAVWHSALCHVAKSKFLRGLTSDFKTDIGSFTRPKNFAKLISGGYGNGAAAIDNRWTQAGHGAPLKSQEQIHAQMLADIAASGYDFIGGGE